MRERASEREMLAAAFRALFCTGASTTVGLMNASSEAGVIQNSDLSQVALIPPSRLGPPAGHHAYSEAAPSVC